MSARLEDLLKMTPAEIQAHNERPTADQLRNKTQTYYEDVNVGDELPKYVYAQTPTHLFRWSAAIENFHRIPLRFGLRHEPRQKPEHTGARLMEAKRGASIP
ncbi:MAG: hypothetical protein CM1200mP22_21830 [Dehalococcoidia bacterium]|nr:MAG: hypothetical protein CM1200mP22_21830 [Dehalococcoidia bacterium]